MDKYFVCDGGKVAGQLAKAQHTVDATAEEGSKKRSGRTKTQYSWLWGSSPHPTIHGLNAAG